MKKNKRKNLPFFQKRTREIKGREKKTEQILKRDLFRMTQEKSGPDNL